MDTILNIIAYIYYVFIKYINLNRKLLDYANHVPKLQFQRAYYITPEIF